MSLKRDLIALYGLPLLIYGGLYWYRAEILDWIWPSAPESDPCRSQSLPLKADTRLSWRGRQIALPFTASSDTTHGRLDVTETFANCEYLPHGAFLSLQELTPATRRAFEEQANSTCGLAEDRCWTTSAGNSPASCMRSGGIPDPTLTWTPTALCIVPAAGIRFLWRGEDAHYLALYHAALDALTGDGGQGVRGAGELIYR